MSNNEKYTYTYINMYIYKGFEETWNMAYLERFAKARYDIITARHTS